MLGPWGSRGWRWSPCSRETPASSHASRTKSSTKSSRPRRTPLQLARRRACAPARAPRGSMLTDRAPPVRSSGASAVSLGSWPGPCSTRSTCRCSRSTTRRSATCSGSAGHTPVGRPVCCTSGLRFLLQREAPGFRFVSPQHEARRAGRRVPRSQVVVDEPHTLAHTHARTHARACTHAALSGNPTALPGPLESRHVALRRGYSRDGVLTVPYQSRQLLVGLFRLHPSLGFYVEGLTHMTCSNSAEVSLPSTQT